MHSQRRIIFALLTLSSMALSVTTLTLLQISMSTDDAFIGLLREGPLTGSDGFGPTITAILADQFHRVFFGAGGQYWEDDPTHVAAVSGYATEIMESTLAQVIFDNSGASVAGNGFTAMPAPPRDPPPSRVTSPPNNGGTNMVGIEVPTPGSGAGTMCATVAAAAVALAAAMAI